jgi:hypothetical protein
MGLSWQGSEYRIILLPPDIFINPLNPTAIPEGAITEENYTTSIYDVEFFDIYGLDQIYPHKFFRVNNPGVGQWTYALIEETKPESPEPVRVYFANESDLVLEFKTDQERYILINDSIPVEISFTATLFQGGETSERLDEHTQTVGEPVTDGSVALQITAPNGEVRASFLDNHENGIYTLKLLTTLTGNYDVSVIASDNPGSVDIVNSEYFIYTEHSFFVSPNVKPEKSSGKYYIQLALDELISIMDTYCKNNNNCSLDRNTKRDINSAISLLGTALTYFEADGNHLNTKKGLSFYDKITSAVNDIYSYLSDPLFGGNIYEAIDNLKQGSYILAVIVRDEALEDGACQVSNCDELIKNANTEIGKALDDSKQNNYVFIFNHLTNAWKFAVNVVGANLKKELVGNDSDDPSIPTEYGLGQNYPNPFNPSTTINFQLPEKKHVSLKIYDIRGTLVTNLVDGEMEAGYHSAQWNAIGYASGVYFYRFSSGSFVLTKRLLLLK